MLGNVQTAEVVPDLKVFEQLSVVPPQKEQPKLGKLSNSHPPEKELAQLTPISLQSGLSVQTLEHAILKKVDLSVCTKWDPADQQDTRKLLEEYTDVSAKDDLNLGQTSVVRHKITLKKGAKLIKEHYRRVRPRLYDEVQKHLQEIIDIRAIQPSNSPWASAIFLVRKNMENCNFASI